MILKEFLVRNITHFLFHFAHLSYAAFLLIWLEVFTYFLLFFSALFDSFIFCRSAGKNMHRSSTEEDSSSEEEMEWSGSNMLLTDLSIPQLDGTADENGGK